MCIRSNLIFFVLVLVLVLVNQYFIEDEHEYDDKGGNCRTVVRRVKTTHLVPPVICYLTPETRHLTPKIKPYFENYLRDTTLVNQWTWEA